MSAIVVAGGGLTLAIAVAFLVYVFPVIKRKLVRFRNRAISNFVNKTVQKLFMHSGGIMQLGEFKASDGSLVKYFKNAPQTLGEWYALSKKHHDKEFLVYIPGTQGKETRWTYAETMSRVEECRHSLVDRFGVKKGDRVAILMSNIPEFCVAFMAITQLGAIAVTLNAFWEGEEIEYGLIDSGSCVLIADEKRLLRLVPNARLESLLKAGLQISVVRPSDEVKKYGIVDFEEISNKLKRPPTWAFDTSIDPTSDAYLMYTSGTLSPRPKGVVQTHLSVVQTCMCFQLYAELLKTLRGEQKKRRVDLVTSPLFHAASLCPTFLLSFFDGHKLVMIPRWDAESALKICVQEAVTFVGVMPTMFADLLACKYFQENKDKFQFTNIGSGGAATPSKLILGAAAVLPKITQGSGWGLTESNCIGTIIGGPEYLEFPNSCGKPHPIVEIKLVDPETGKEIEDVNEPGELYIRSITNMRCYWNNPEETKKILLPGNWIRSGDLGKRDSEGFIYIIDRIKDIVIRGGENISTSEVEEVLHAFSHANVGSDGTGVIYEACTFGLPHERLGEQLAAVIVPFPGKTLDVEALKSYCHQRLAKFKVPSVFIVRNDPLPRGGTGKILKRKLKEQYAKVAV
jgi:long-chain acyl-CoA synthetase